MANYSAINTIPVMISNTVPSGIASASSIYSNSYDAWKAFDKLTTNWQTLTNAKLPHWLSYEFNENKIIGKYSITSISSFSQAPKDWTFEGSNDGVNWVILDTQISIVFVANERKEFIVSNPQSFKKYRINITANNGNISHTSLSEFEMFETVYINKILISLDDSEHKSVVKGGYTDNLIPEMASNTSPFGIAKNSGGSVSAYKHFDGALAGAVSLTIPNGWIEYQFSSPMKINKYTITPTTATNAPKDWVFQGSVNGVDWVDLDKKTGVSWVVGNYVTEEFLFDNNSVFTHYRLYVTAGNSISFHIAEMEMMSLLPSVILSIPSVSEQNFKNHGMDKPLELDMSQVFTQKEIINADGSSTIIDTEPFTLADEFKGKQIKILHYTDNPDTQETIIETETEPYDIYDEFGDSMEVLYYTDDPDKTESKLEIIANYSPLDELDGDFEVVTWTDEVGADVARTLTMNALPKSQFIKQATPITIQDELSKTTSTGTQDKPMYLVSSDKVTWKKHNGMSFINAATQEEAMTGAEMSSITKEQWKQLGKTVYIGIYVDENSVTNSISYAEVLPKESTQISDARLYILNTVSTINLSFAGSTLTGVLDDEDRGKVQYRVMLNGSNYFPKDGSFTKLSPAPLDIDITLTNKDYLIDQQNTLRVEFKDFWGTTDFWETVFVGTYSGIMFTDKMGEYYSSDIGEILKKLDFGIVVAGQTTTEQEVVLKNTYGYPIKSVKLYTQEGALPQGIKAQFGSNLISFEGTEELHLNKTLEHNEEYSFYIRLVTKLGIAPAKSGNFSIVVVADRVMDQATTP